MIHVSGSGVQARTTLCAWALPEGYYQLIAHGEATNVAVGVPTFRIHGYINSTDRFGSAIGYPSGSYETAPIVYLVPGDDIAFSTEQETWGSNPDANWDLKIYIYAAAEVAQG